jgi:hypothetical protein
MKPRKRIPGEQIAAGDVVMLGTKAFPVLDTCLIGMPVLRGELNAVYTSEPRTTLQEPFPARPERPTCACGVASEYELDGVYVCRPHFEEARAVGRG